MPLRCSISSIKEAKAEREPTLKARQEMKAEAERIALDQQRHDEEHAQARKRSDEVLSVSNHGLEAEKEDSELPITVGSIVRIDGQETFAQVVEMKGKKAVVESNSIRMTIALNRLKGTAKKNIPVDKLSRQNSRFQSIYDGFRRRFI